LNKISSFSVFFIFMYRLGVRMWFTRLPRASHVVHTFASCVEDLESWHIDATVCNHFIICASTVAVLPCPMSRKWSPLIRYTLRPNTASTMKALVLVCYCTYTEIVVLLVFW